MQANNKSKCTVPCSAGAGAGAAGAACIHESSQYQATQQLLRRCPGGSIDPKTVHICSKQHVQSPATVSSLQTAYTTQGMVVTYLNFLTVQPLHGRCNNLRSQLNSVCCVHGTALLYGRL